MKRMIINTNKGDVDEMLYNESFWNVNKYVLLFIMMLLAFFAVFNHSVRADWTNTMSCYHCGKTVTVYYGKSTYGACGYTCTNCTSDCTAGSNGYHSWHSGGSSKSCGCTLCDDCDVWYNKCSSCTSDRYSCTCSGSIGGSTEPDIPVTCNHVYGNWSESGNYHVRYCVNSSCDDYQSHTANMGSWSKLNDSYHERECKEYSCTISEEASHSGGGTWQTNGTQHWHYCSTCSSNYSTAAHTWVDNNETNHICSTCSRPENHYDSSTDSDYNCDACGHLMAIDITGLATIAGVADQIYTGDPITPKPAVTYNSVTLVEGTDFTYSYSNNTNPGQATVTANGINDYTGSVSTTFNIMGVFNGSVSISGETKYNKVLTVNTSAITPNSGNTYNYQWWVADNSSGTNKSNISGETNSYYLVERLYIDKFIGVTVTVSKDYYISKSFDAIIDQAISVDKRVIIGEDSVQVYLDDVKPAATAEDVLYPNKATIVLVDADSGVVGWQVTDNNDVVPTSGWTNIERTNSITFSDSELRNGGLYYVWAIDLVGNVSVGDSFQVIADVTINDITAKIFDENTGKEKAAGKSGDIIEISIVIDDLYDLTIDEDKIIVTIGGVTKEIVDIEIVDNDDDEKIVVVKVIADQTEGEVSITVGDSAIKNSLDMTNKEYSKDLGVFVDNTPPVIDSVQIKDDSSSLDSVVVNVEIVANEDAKYVFVSNYSTAPTEESEGWVPYTGEVVHTLLQGDGVKTVYVWAMDEAGNVSLVKSDSTEVEAIYISSNSETTLKFKIYDLNLYSSQINKDNIELYVDGAKVDATIVSCDNIPAEATATEHFYKIVVKDLQLTTDVILGDLGIGLNGAIIYDKAENLLTVTTDVVGTEIKVDNVEPEISVSGNVITATDETLVSLTVDGNVVIATDGVATYTATSFKEAIAIDKAGNVMRVLGQ